MGLLLSGFINALEWAMSNNKHFWTVCWGMYCIVISIYLPLVRSDNGEKYTSFIHNVFKQTKIIKFHT